MTAVRSELQVVLVCGVSGVGKTHLIRSFLSSHPTATTLSAGAIISEARKIDDPEFLRTLATDQLARSQELLIAGFHKLVPTLVQPLLLLDAHTLIDNGHELYVISDAVFSALQPVGIIHVEADPAIIARQRQSDAGRTRPSRSVEELAEYQRRSAQRVREIASHLEIWSATVCSGDARTFADLFSHPL